MTRKLLGTVGPLGFLAIWEAYVRVARIEPLVLPGPIDTFKALIRDRSLLLEALAITASEVLLGLIVSLIFGALIAVVMHLNYFARATLNPLVVASQAIPLPVLAPVLTFWLGFGVLPKLGIVALICFFPIAIATLDALDQADSRHQSLLKNYGASRWQQLRHAAFPAALPAAFSGAKVAVAIGAIAAVFAEYSGSTNGLGHVILQAQPALATDRAFAAVALLAIFSVAATGGLSQLASRLSTWK